MGKWIRRALLGVLMTLAFWMGSSIPLAACCCPNQQGDTENYMHISATCVPDEGCSEANPWCISQACMKCSDQSNVTFRWCGSFLACYFVDFAGECSAFICW